MIAADCKPTCSRGVVLGRPSRLACVPESAWECGFRRFHGPGSSSIRRIRSNSAGGDVLQSGAEWVSVAPQSWSIGPG
jgi:hypothetical protein